MTVEIKPLEPPYDAATQEELDRLMGGSGREPLRLFRTLAKHLPLTRAWGTLGAHNLGNGALPVRDRELLILRTCFLNGCEYEWGVHVKVYAKAASLSLEQCLAAARPRLDAPDWTPQDYDVLAFADSLHRDGRVPSELLKRLRERWDDAQVLEACEVAGFYHGVAFMANVAGVDLEDWAARFP